MRYFYLTILILTQSVIHAAIFPNLKTNVLETWNEDDKTRTDVQKAMRHFQNNKGENIQQKNLIQNKELKNDQNIDVYLDLLASKLAENDRRRASRKNFYGHPIFNELKNKRLRSLRRQRLSKDDLFGDSSTNTKERERGNKEMEEAWLLKKMQALNSSTIRGDVANMAAARPWAVPCGDPIQHDMPWGTCMVQTQCEPEYRIYRGDSFCGQTRFICCALQPTNYDLYHAIDISAAEAGTSYSTDSDDAYRDKVMGSREVSKKRDRRQRRNRKLDRAKRKKKMIKSIKRIIQEIKDILNKAYSNATTVRQKRTTRLQQLVYNMKKQFRLDRKAVISAHHAELKDKDEAFQAKLNGVRGLNNAYMTNDTFRSIIINGTVDKEKLRSVLQQYPQLQEYMKAERRVDGGDADTESDEAVDLKLKLTDSKPAMDEYDLEYGMIYF
ncbi:uncharacterized protein LOC118275733 [Spodoptera frugiperda]|uniref:Uncharacterized protein LOC118275733 n=1 Tax=Spodoptera frugiperda TaxID=7108 RepID=A0A9R0DDU9_SPOFR|nr:uncharacterized protein LOC118275733 [Spodoptera frugiperda]